MNRLLFGGALGALAMYFLDAGAGRRRRARTRDRMLHAARVLNEAGRLTARDTAHRAQGLLAGTRRLFRHEEVSDDALVGRVRAALGRVVSHPHAVEVTAAEGYVTLAGPVLSYEVRPLLRCVRHVPGVRAVNDRLTVYQEPGNVPSLQGGVPRRPSRFELAQENWSPAARLLAGSAGAALVLGAMRARGARGALLGLAGGGLLARSATNLDTASLLGFGRRGITVQKVINVQAPSERVFEFWTDYQNFPRFMTHVRDVHEAGENRWHWIVAGPAGVPVEWTAEVTRVIRGMLIEWRCTGHSRVRHEGSVRFDPNADGSTRVTVHMSYVPPAGAFGHAVAALFGADPKSEMDADLLRMKTMIETGRAPHDAAQRGSTPRES
jgi:uncharacterized membrane protein